MNAIDLLKDDHREVSRLFSEFLDSEDCEPELREEIFQQLEKELLVHTEVEEQIFYPAVREFASKEVDDAMREHQQVKQLLVALLDLDIEDEDFEPRLMGLMEQVQRHVQEEESPDGILETARREMNPFQLRQLAVDIENLKKDSEEELAA